MPQIPPILRIRRTVKPARFSYHQAASVEEAVALLEDLGEDAKLLAGGQSLVPMMNLRLARPAALVDITRISDLSYYRDESGVLRVGALTRHRELERAMAPIAGLEVIPKAAAEIGHLPIRVRGTLGGSIAHADPVSEWCLVACLLDARVVIQGLSGRHTRPIEGFFRGYFDTVLQPTDVILELEFPWRPTASGFAEFARRRGDFAVVAAAAAIQLDGTRRIERAAVALGGVDSTVVRAREAESVLIGEEPSSPLWQEAASLAASQLDPPTDLHGDGEYRRHLARALVTQALVQAVPA